MNDPYQEWIETEAAQARADDRREQRRRHTPPETVQPVAYRISVPDAEHVASFDQLNDAVAYIRSLLIAGVPASFETVK